jgi:hypothetical protein
MKENEQPPVLTFSPEWNCYEVASELRSYKYNFVTEVKWTENPKLKYNSDTEVQ